MARILTSDGRLILDRVAVSRAGQQKNAKGLLGRTGLEAGEGLLLSDPTGTIHMFFMRFPIDAVFCDRDLVVLDVVRDLKPWKTAGRKGAKVVVELAAGAGDDLRSGDRLVVDTIGP
jgi:uncharacterized membrane protein (UPF0127 family)